MLWLCSSFSWQMPTCLINNQSHLCVFPSLSSVTSPSLLLPLSPLNPLWLSGDPGHDRTAQAKQRNVQQSFQQLLLPGGWPRPGVTGQSRSISQRIDPSIRGVVLCNESRQASRDTRRVRHSLVFVCPQQLSSMDVVVSHTHIKRLFLFIPDSCSRSVCESLFNPQNSLMTL